MTTPTRPLVLVTGGTGYIATFTILALLRRNYPVRATIRSPAKIPHLHTMLQRGGATATQLSNLSTITADLTSDTNWAEACAGAEYVLHVAAPLPARMPKEREGPDGPTRAGTLRVLRAARDSGRVKRVVITGTVLAMMRGREERIKVFTEGDWSVLDGKVPVDVYSRAKTEAERDAWEWIGREGGGMELVVVNPAYVLGPLMDKDASASTVLVRRLVNGEMPGLPKVTVNVVDVRDVAELHVLAMEMPNAAGERFIASADDKAISIREMADILRSGLTPEDGKHVPQRTVPNMLIRLASLWDAELGYVTPSLGKDYDLSNAKAKKDLGWTPRPAQESILDSARSFKEFGLTKT